MSNVTAAFDELRALVPTILTDYEELNSPYAIEDNSDLTLSRGWSVAFADGENTNRVVGCKLSMIRNFEIIMTRRLYTTSRDITNRIIMEKDMFEDQLSLISALEKATSSVMSRVEYVSDEGISFIEGDRLQFYMLNSKVAVEIFENL